MIDVRRRLARATFWNIAGNGVYLASGLAASIATARILGATGFGEVAMTRATLYTLTILCGASLAAATARAVAAARVSPDEAGRVIGFFLHTAAVLSVAATVACIAFAGPIAAHLAAPQLTPLLALSAPYVVFASIASVQTGTLNALDAFAASARLLAFEGAVTAALVTAAAWTSGATAAVVALAAGTAIAAAVRQLVLHRTCRAAGIPIRYRGLRAQLALLPSVVVPSLIFAAAAQPFLWIARAILARNSGGLIEVGVFTAAYTWGAAVIQVPGQVTRPAMPILAHLHASGKADEYRRLVRDVLRLALGASLLVAIPLMIASPWIMRAYGAPFRGGSLALVLVAASSVFAGVSGALRSALIAEGLFWRHALLALVSGVVLVGTFLLLRGHGANGLAAAHVVAYALALALQAVMMRRHG